MEYYGTPYKRVCYGVLLYKVGIDSKSHMRCVMYIDLLHLDIVGLFLYECTSSFCKISILLICLSFFKKKILVFIPKFTKVRLIHNIIVAQFMFCMPVIKIWGQYIDNKLSF